MALYMTSHLETLFSHCTMRENSNMAPKWTSIIWSIFLSVAEWMALSQIKELVVITNKHNYTFLKPEFTLLLLVIALWILFPQLIVRLGLGIPKSEFFKTTF